MPSSSVNIEEYSRLSRQMMSGEEEALKTRIATLGPRVSSPLVSVIIAAYNVAPYLKRAVSSALDQTLRRLEVIVVDDHSTDQTLAVAVGLAEADDRVRILRTEKNSGGPGEPRNIGIKNCRSEYYTFLDGDDTLELHACKTLLEYAELSDADLVVGRTERYHVKNGQMTPWYPQIFQELHVAIDANEMPELLSDSIAAGKLYKKSFTVENDNWLLNGVHFEDLIFTARAYAQADIISVVPSTTYYWYVYPEDERTSITAQNDTLKNLLDRRDALRMVDSALELSGKSSLIERAKHKFLWHDAKLYLNMANESTDEWLLGVCDILIPKLKSFTPEDWTLIDVYAQWIYGSVLNRDLEGIRQAILFSRDRGILSGRKVKINGHMYWQPGGTSQITVVPGTLGSKLLDLTNHPVLDMPPSSVRPRTVVHHIERVDSWTLAMNGHTDDLLGYLSGAKVALRAKLKDGRETFDIPVSDVNRADDGGVDWSLRFSIPDDIVLARPQRWIFTICFDVDGVEVKSSLRLSPSIGKYDYQIRQTGILPQALRRKYRLYVTANNHLGIRLLKADGKRGRVDRTVAKTSVMVSKLSTATKRKVDIHALLQGYSVMRHLPIDEHTVLCESMSGRSLYDSPRYVAEELLKRSTEYTVYWVYSGPVAPALPRGFFGVRRWSPEYLRRVATAKILVDNQTFPKFFQKREGQIYLQTWHGIPLKKMGVDSPEFRFARKVDQTDLIARGAQWDALVCPNSYFNETFVNGYRYEGHLLEGGTPRNDVLVRDRNQREEYKRRLALPLDRKIVLYAPTFRQSTGHSSVVRPSRAFPVRDWADRLGNDTYLIVHPHYLDKFPIPRSLAPYVISAPKGVNVNDLYLASDLLITDYSSVMFDFATLDRPIVFFTYDYDSYVNAERGTYFSLKDEAPGPLVESFDDLLDAVQQSLVAAHGVSGRYRDFKNKYCGDEDGRASVRAVDYLLAKVGER